MYLGVKLYPLNNFLKIRREIIDVGILDSNAVWICTQTPPIWRNILPPSSGLK